MMKNLFLICMLAIFFSGCGVQMGYNRPYIISETDEETTPPASESDQNRF